MGQLGGFLPVEVHTGSSVPFRVLGIEGAFLILQFPIHPRGVAVGQLGVLSLLGTLFPSPVLSFSSAARVSRWLLVRLFSLVGVVWPCGSLHSLNMRLA